jgi:hypothetical protein
LHSPLLRLPAEIRNQIFNYAFSNFVINAMMPFKDALSRQVQLHEVIRLEDWYNKKCANRSLREFLESTTVCRQIHAETAPLLFHNNLIRFGNMDMAAPFLAKMRPSQQHTISHVQLYVEAWNATVYETWAEKFLDSGVAELRGLGQIGFDVYGNGWDGDVTKFVLQEMIRNPVDSVRVGEVKVFFGEPKDVRRGSKKRGSHIQTRYWGQHGR